MKMLERGGQFEHPKQKGVICGNGYHWHYRRYLGLLWPHVLWHKWNELIVKEYLEHETIALMGPASTGKTHTVSMCMLGDYYLRPFTTTVIVCSTTIALLEQRIWGEMKGLHKAARKLHEDLPGNLIEGKRRIVSDGFEDIGDGRDFRNGAVGLPAKQGEASTTLSDFVGIKNRHVRLAVDELPHLPRGIVDAISNLAKNPDFKFCGMGNPKETTDAFGVLAEPSAELGGWDSNIDQVLHTKSWKTRRPKGVCVQLVGTDSPNLDGKLGIPLITQETINADIAFYGKDSLQYTQMNLGVMPRGQGSRRVITRNLCEKFQARDEPVWADSNRIKIASLDAAYRGVGGDRCVLMFSEFGEQAADEADLGTRVVQSLMDQSLNNSKRPIIFALTDTVIVPIKGNIKDDPEDQIAEFVMKECESRGVPPQNFFYDSGMRTSLVQAFGRLWSAYTNSIDCGGQPSDRKVSWDIDVLCKDYYSKRITELWYSVRYLIEAGQFRGMTDEAMLEGCAREFTKTAGNKIEVEPKEKMKMRIGRSPDLFDCLALGVWGALEKGLVIRRTKSARRHIQDDSWKDAIREKAANLWRSHELVHKD